MLEGERRGRRLAQCASALGLPCQMCSAPPRPRCDTNWHEQKWPEAWLMGHTRHPCHDERDSGTPRAVCAGCRLCGPPLSCLGGQGARGAGRGLRGGLPILLSQPPPPPP
eukprot:gene19150-biopygen23466